MKRIYSQADGKIVSRFKHLTGDKNFQPDTVKSDFRRENDGKTIEKFKNVSLYKTTKVILFLFYKRTTYFLLKSFHELPKPVMLSF